MALFLVRVAPPLRASWLGLAVYCGLSSCEVCSAVAPPLEGRLPLGLCPRMGATPD